MTAEPLDLDLLDRLLARAGKHVALPFERDTDDSEGAYGNGPNTREGYRSPYIMDGVGRRVFSCDGNDIALIEEEYDEDACTATDMASLEVADLSVAAVNALPALIRTAREVEGLREALTRLPDKMRRQVECVRGYDSQASDVIGLSAVSISVGHFLDMADEIEAALSPSGAGGGK